MQSHFHVEARHDGRSCVLDVSGELDLAAASSLEEELDRVLASDAEQIVLDLKSLDFIDSTGLSVLVRGHQRAQETSREFGLVNPTAQVERLLTLTGLADRLTLPDQSPSDGA